MVDVARETEAADEESSGAAAGSAAAGVGATAAGGAPGDGAAVGDGALVTQGPSSLAPALQRTLALLDLYDPTAMTPQEQDKVSWDSRSNLLPPAI